MATPVTNISIAFLVGSKLSSIGNLHAWHRIRIEIVVNVQSVNIVTFHDVHHDGTDVVAILLHGWIQQCQSVIVEAALRMTARHMSRTQGVGSLRLGAIGIDPGVQLHTTLVALFNHPLQRVPIRLWCLALLTCQEVAPWLQLTLIEGITLWAHLKDDSVATILLQFVQLVRECLLHLLGRHALELSVDTLYPCPTELTFFLCLSR